MFIAIGSFAWGKGDTVKKAVQECRKHIHGNGAHELNVYEIPEEAFQGVDAMGRIHFDNTKGQCEKRDPVTVTIKRRGY